jgi:hypothetical protein
VPKGGGGEERKKTYDADKEVRCPVVVKLVLEEWNLCVEEDRIWTRELGDGDRVLGVVGIPRYPLCGVSGTCVI